MQTVISQRWQDLEVIHPQRTTDMDVLQFFRTPVHYIVHGKTYYVTSYTPGYAKGYKDVNLPYAMLDDREEIDVDVAISRGQHFLAKKESLLGRPCWIEYFQKVLEKCDNDHPRLPAFIEVCEALDDLIREDKQKRTHNTPTKAPRRI